MSFFLTACLLLHCNGFVVEGDVARVPTRKRELADKGEGIGVVVNRIKAY